MRTGEKTDSKGGRQWGEGEGRGFQRLLWSPLLQVNAANLQGGPQDLASNPVLTSSSACDLGCSPQRLRASAFSWL